MQSKRECIAIISGILHYQYHTTFFQHLRSSCVVSLLPTRPLYIIVSNMLVSVRPSFGVGFALGNVNDIIGTFHFTLGAHLSWLFALVTK